MPAGISRVVLRTRATDDTFTLVHIPVYRLVCAAVGSVMAAFMLAWIASDYFLRGLTSDFWWTVILGAVFVGSLVILISSRTTKLIVNRHLRNVYWIRMFGAWRSLRSFEFDEISEGLYVFVEECQTDGDPRFLYSLWLRLKFEEDLLVASKSNKDGNGYTDAARDGNKYFCT